MSKELEPARDLVIAGQINYIKHQTAQMCIQASIEIGRLLCEAKELVPHGEWGDWLEKNVSYSVSNANNLMRIYREYGEGGQIDLFSSKRAELFGNLSPSQAIALFALPEGEREEFVQSHDMESMSVRDIKAEIKARQEAERRAKEAEELAAEANREKEKAEQAFRHQVETNQGLKSEAEKLRAELKAVQDNAGKVSEKEKSQIKAEVEAEYKKKLAEAEKKAQQLQIELDNVKSNAGDEEDEPQESAPDTEAIKAEIAAEYEARIVKIEAERKAEAAKYATAGDVEVQKFAVHFETFQSEFNILAGCLSRLGERNSETAAKLRAGLRSVIEQMGDSID